MKIFNLASGRALTEMKAKFCVYDNLRRFSVRSMKLIVILYIFINY